VVATGELNAGQELLSLNRRYRFKFQVDGDLTLTDLTTGELLWSSNTTGGQGDALIMQADGNLVLYTTSNEVVWSSESYSDVDDYFLLLQDDGNLVIYRGKQDGTSLVPIWSTETGQ
jgi:hypothetical protein